MMRTLRKTLLLFAVTWSLVLLPQQALADGTLSCYNGSPVAGTQLYNTTPGDSGSACYLTGWHHIFSHVICNFVTILDDVLGKVYCGMQAALVSILAAIITIYVAVFGVQILMGATTLHPREIITRLLKIAFIWLFATESAWGIGIAFNFFITLAGQGVEWVMTAIPNQLDPDVASICYDAAAQNTTGLMSAFARMDELICNAVSGPITQANEKVLGFFLGLAIVIPPLFLMGAYWLWMNFSILVRALISFVLGISALAFLIAVSPIFLSMMLFQPTVQFFENWLRYMISFALQIIVIFACIALWMVVTIHFVNFFNEISDTIFPFQKNEVVSAAQDDQDKWAICPYDYADNPNPPIPGRPEGPYVKCKKADFDPIANEVDRDKLIPVSALIMTTNPVNQEPINNTTYLFYIAYHLITLIILAYAFEALMRDAPAIATQLAGPQYTPSLGGSSSVGFNRYGQLMTRNPISPERGKGFTTPEFLKNLGNRGVAAATGNVTKNIRERMGGMFR